MRWDKVQMRQNKRNVGQLLELYERRVERHNECGGDTNTRGVSKVSRFFEKPTALLLFYFFLPFQANFFFGYYAFNQYFQMFLNDTLNKR